MKSFPLIPYALVGLVVLGWWAGTQSWVALGVMVVLLAVAALHVIKATSGPGSLGSGQDQAEARARATFPTPPERPHGI
ncbi:hypothetical protein [uncultured Serinicoccus sp.]|uniref:hypothetical protein n=1 Tax=uncultured Serinicoccus sp. TaxID=735514 RepID=UPI002623E39D|nr:hypothetical protein [uncultured Serinicoccus sp.]